MGFGSLESRLCNAKFHLRNCADCAKGKPMILIEDYKSDNIQSPKNFVLLARPKKGGGFDMSSFGRISDVNIWRRVFTEEDVQAWTK